ACTTSITTRSRPPAAGTRRKPNECIAERDRGEAAQVVGLGSGRRHLQLAQQARLPTVREGEDRSGSGDHARSADPRSRRARGSRLEAGREQREAFARVVGAENVLDDDEMRVVHSFGRSLPDLVRARHGDFARIVDAVVYPGSEEEIAAVLRIVLEADLVLIPYGGGSCISGSVTPDTTEQRPVVTMNLGRMREVLRIDDTAGLAHVQAGVYGPDLEEQLNALGWTMGHFPDSFTYSTLGGWAATRSSGMQSDKYGDIEQIVRGLRMVHPDGVAATKPIPGRDAGPSVHEMILGSEGRLGIISECTVQIHRMAPV